jgi:hypothetical protein
MRPAHGKPMEQRAHSWAWFTAEAPKPTVRRNRVWLPRGHDDADARAGAAARRHGPFHFVIPFSKLRNSKKCQLSWNSPKINVVEEL